MLPGHGQEPPTSFTGWVAPTIEYVAGHSLSGRVLGTAAADAAGGSSGGVSDNLAPGQSEVLYSCPQDMGIKPGTYVSFALTQVEYGTPGQGTIDGATVYVRS